MCGIISVFNLDNKPASEQTHLILEDQLSRGQEGFGLIAAKLDGTYTVKRATELVKASLDLYFASEPIILLHHRWPSSTENTLRQTHPIVVSDPILSKKYLVIHNGCVSNDRELKAEHEDKFGLAYTTVDDETVTKKFNDSEALAIDMALYLEKKKPLPTVIGTIAAIILGIDKTQDKITDVWFYTNKYDSLNLASSRNKIIISSEGPGNAVATNLLYHFVWGKWKWSKTKLLIPTSDYNSGYNSGYDGYQSQAPASLPITTIGSRPRAYAWKDDKLTAVEEDSSENPPEEEIYNTMYDTIEEKITNELEVAQTANSWPSIADWKDLMREIASDIREGCKELLKLNWDRASAEIDKELIEQLDKELEPEFKSPIIEDKLYAK